ncbi:unnamed protein product [Penicillium bialowiezense]
MDQLRFVAAGTASFSQEYTIPPFYADLTSDTSVSRLWLPLAFFKLGQRTVISIGNRQVIHDLLEKRSRIFSSRPRLISLNETLLRGMLPALWQYGEKWLQVHRFIQGILSKPVAFSPIIDLESKRLLHRMSAGNWTPDLFSQFVESYTSLLAYGSRVYEDHPTMRVDFLRVQSTIASGYGTGDIVADLYPALGPLIALFPSIKKSKAIADDFYSAVINTFQEKCALGLQARSGNWTQYLEKSDLRKCDTDEGKFLIAELEIASTVSSSILLSHFISICLIFPEQAKMVQDELDQVIGITRLPTFEDQSKLPYTQAFLSEIIRVVTMLPLGVPHAATEDDVYMGYRIPENAIILANQWAVNMDPGVYKDPTTFRLQRWIENPRLQRPAFFGFGKRICPGQALAQNSFFITVSRVLWGYEARQEGPKVDCKGLLTDVSWETTLIQSPKLDNVKLVVRSDQHSEVIEKEWSIVQGTEEILLDNANKAFA